MHAADFLASLPAVPPPPATLLPGSRAPHPVWSGSIIGRDVAPAAPPPAYVFSRKQVARLYHSARRMERDTRRPRRQDGALGRNALRVYEALLFDFYSYRTGRCDPAVATLARAANVSTRSAYRGLAVLRAAGLVSWTRRAIRTTDKYGREVRRQIENAYAINPESAWLCHCPTRRAPDPHPDTWGAIPSALDAAAQAVRLGGSRYEITSLLESDPGNPVASALASFSTAFHPPSTSQNPSKI